MIGQEYAKGDVLTYKGQFGNVPPENLGIDISPFFHPSFF